MQNIVGSVGELMVIITIYCDPTSQLQPGHNTATTQPLAQVCRYHDRTTYLQVDI